MSHHTSGASVVVYPPKNPRPSLKPSSLGQPEKVAGDRGEILREPEYERERGKEEFEGREELAEGHATSTRPSERPLSPPPSKENVIAQEKVARTTPLPEGREAEMEVRGKYLMQEYLRDETKQLRLMTVCAEAIAACMQCELLSFKTDLDCANVRFILLRFMLCKARH